MNIGEAVKLLKMGNRIRRQGWEGHLVIKKGLIELKGEGKTKLWNPTQDDVKADDWLWVV